MRRSLIILIFAVMLAACEKNEATEDEVSTEDAVLRNGLYKGTFNRTGMDTVKVDISVYNGLFEGNSERQFYPALCRGSYRREGMNISFNDSCTWQANFDWSLILNGRYEMRMNGDELLMRRSSGTFTDEYRLRRITR